MWTAIFVIIGLLGSFIAVMTIIGRLTQKSIEQTEAEWSVKRKVDQEENYENWKAINWGARGLARREKPKKSPAETIHDCDRILIILAGVLIFLFLILLPIMDMMDFNECMEVTNGEPDCINILK